jgi:hypothetical protein
MREGIVHITLVINTLYCTFAVRVFMYHSGGVISILQCLFALSVCTYHSGFVCEHGFHVQLQSQGYYSASLLYEISCTSVVMYAMETFTHPSIYCFIIKHSTVCPFWDHGESFWNRCGLFSGTAARIFWDHGEPLLGARWSVFGIGREGSGMEWTGVLCVCGCLCVCFRLKALT